MLVVGVTTVLMGLVMAFQFSDSRMGTLLSEMEHLARANPRSSGAQQMALVLKATFLLPWVHLLTGTYVTYAAWQLKERNEVGLARLEAWICVVPFLTGGILGILNTGVGIWTLMRLNAFEREKAAHQSGAQAVAP
jgi:hypothetical protein